MNINVQETFEKWGRRNLRKMMTWEKSESAEAA